MEPAVQHQSASAPVPAEGPATALLRIERMLATGRLDAAQSALAPLLRAFPDDFAVLRMQARAQRGDDAALAAWRALHARFPDDVRSHVDLAEALRRHGHDDAAADAVLAAADARFPQSPWVLEGLAMAADRRGDRGAAARLWRAVLNQQPGHARALSALSVLSMLEQMELGDRPAHNALVQRHRPAAAPPPEPAPAKDAAAAPEPEPVVPAPIPVAEPVKADEPVIEPEPARETEATSEPEAAPALAPALMPALAPAAPEPAEPPPDPAAPGFEPARQEVQSLCQSGRWQAAMVAGAKLFENFPTEPRAGEGLIDALVALGRPGEAEVVLREAQQRFPANRALAIRLARLCAARGAAAEAVTWWRKAGLPVDGSAAELRDFAHALQQAGMPDGVEMVLQSAPADLADRRLLLLARAEVMLRSGQLTEAMALWPELRAAFGLDHAEFCAFAWALAMEAHEEAATVLLGDLLDEPDQPGPDWMPTIGRELARLAPADPAHARVRTALAAAPALAGGPPLLARAIAASLTGPEPDADALALRIGRAVHEGKPELLGLLLETHGHPGRLARMRVGLRLYVNGSFADPARFDRLDAGQVAVLLLICRALDTDSFVYLAGLARQRFPAMRLPNLPRAQDVAGCVAHARWPDERPRPAVPPIRMRVAVCVHGHARAEAPAKTILQALRLEDHHATVFAHLWRRTSSTGAVAASQEELLHRLPPTLRRAVVRASALAGAAELRALFPNLLSATAAAAEIDEAAAAARYGTSHVVIEDETLPALRLRPPAWLARYKVMLAHRMAVQSGAAFDLILHVAAETDLQAPPKLKWNPIATEAAARGVVFADTGLQFRRGSVLSLGAALVAGTRADMDVAADSFALGEHIASGQAHVALLPLADIHRHSQPIFQHLLGVGVETLPGFTTSPVSTVLPPLSPSAALAMVWESIRARPASPFDSALVQAATADMTGGLAP
jgi:tetratricopeptide (TPR) repeat protein